MGMRETIDESVRDVIAEADLRNIRPGITLLIRADAIITPSAQDIIHEKNIEVVRRPRKSTVSGSQRLIALGADHGGFEMKEQLKKLLGEMGYRSRDFGTFSTDAVDYPDYAHAVARAVSEKVCELGIIIDGAGIGSCMTANKIPGVLAAMCYDEATARNSREHNFANVLTLGGKMISAEHMQKIVRAWLSTETGEARHRKRVEKILTIEKQYLK
jgi:ribose 5-phosphate isomerase B